MTVDVAVVGAPFLDLTFEGLGRIPGVGEEVVARSLHIAPGGTGMQAVGAARLGLTAVLVARLGDDLPAALVRGVLESEGVRITGPRGAGPRSQGAPPAAPGVPVTALLSTPEGVAMATGPGGYEPCAEEVAEPGARALVLSLGRLPLAPPDAVLYAVTGGLELAHAHDVPRERLAAVRALVVNAAEASLLTGRSDPEDGARDLARRAATVVVTLGAEGALAVSGERFERARAPRVDCLDATGAGDLFTAAYVWADLRGAPLADRLAWASLYAGLSVRAPTALAGALGLEVLLAEGRARGLAAPGGPAAPEPRGVTPR